MRWVTAVAVLLGGVCGYVVNVSTHADARASAPRTTFVVVPRLVPMPSRVIVAAPAPAVASVPCSSATGPAPQAVVPAVPSLRKHAPATEAEILRPRDSKEWNDFRDTARAELGRDADAFIAEHERLCDEVSQTRLGVKGMTGDDTYDDAKPMLTSMVDAYKKRAEFVKTLPEFADGKNADKLARLSRPWIVACFGQEALDAIEQR